MKLCDEINEALSVNESYDFNDEDVAKEFSKLGFKDNKIYGLVSPAVKDDKGFYNWYSVTKVLDKPIEITGYAGTTEYTSKANKGNPKTFETIKDAVKYYNKETK